MEGHRQQYDQNRDIYHLPVPDRNMDFDCTNLKVYVLAEVPERHVPAFGSMDAWRKELRQGYSPS